VMLLFATILCAPVGQDLQERHILLLKEQQDPVIQKRAAGSLALHGGVRSVTRGSLGIRAIAASVGVRSRSTKVLFT